MKKKNAPKMRGCNLKGALKPEVYRIASLICTPVMALAAFYLVMFVLLVGGK